jgi:hypothetical protein
MKRLLILLFFFSLFFRQADARLSDLALNCSPKCCGLFDNYYIGCEGGWSAPFLITPRSSETEFRGIPRISRDLHLSSGYHFGLNVGCMCNRYMRVDISYTFLSNPARWRLQLDGMEGTFDAQLHTHLVLFNGYLHLNKLCRLKLHFAPYLTAGIGAVVTDLTHVKEHNAPALFTLVNGERGITDSNFAARVGLGFLKPFFCNWVIDAGFNLNYIGGIATGNQLPLDEILITGIIPDPLEHPHNWISTLFIGLKYQL